MDPDPAHGMLGRLAEYEEAGAPTATLYDEWSESYEHDLLVRYGYTAHSIAVDAFARMCPDRSAEVVDVGCGTGLVGVELARLGFATFDGVDISEPMQNIARSKGVYRRVFTGDLTSPTSIENGAYQGAICVGSFAPGHLGPSSLAEIARCVESGGPIVIFMNGVHFIADNYEQHIEKLVERDVWRVEEITSHNYMSALDRPGRLIVVRR